MSSFRIYPLNEKAVSVEFGSQINSETHQKVLQADLLVKERNFDGFIETVPAYTTLTVYFDPLAILEQPDLKGSNSFERIELLLSDVINQTSAEMSSEFPMVTIPVRYGADYGPDLGFVSDHCNLSVDEIIRLHTETVYKVYMIGFSPGFPYLGILPLELEVPRKIIPMSNVPAGSVAIAGRQSGIYPFETPGGWQIIGRTPLHLFDTGKQDSSLLKAGWRVQFNEITTSQFEQFQQP